MNSFVEVLGNSLDNIKTVDNFIEEKDMLLVKDFLDDLSNSDASELMHLKEIYHFNFSKEIREIIKKYDSLIVKKAEELYGFKFIDGVNILRGTIHKIGSWSHPHTDILEAELEPQKPDDEEFIGWRDAWDGYLACNIYLNDNYSGGEVFFPERDVSIKPVAGQLILWPGNKYFIHGVNDPIDAGRYTLTRWIKFVDFDKYTA
jgi:hypothetical protein